MMRECVAERSAERGSRVRPTGTQVELGCGPYAATVTEVGAGLRTFDTTIAN